MVLATTIDKYCHISCRHLPPFFEHKHRIVYSNIENVTNIDEIRHPAVKAVLGWSNCQEGLEIHHDGDLPARAGLGSSSSFTVGLVNALRALEGRRVTKKNLAKNAIHIEQNIINENVGSQDQILAAYGGFNQIEFNRDDSFNVSPIILAGHRRQELESHLMLFFTGITRFASDIARNQVANFNNRQTELLRMKEMVDEAIDILMNPETPVREFGKLLHESWKCKRSLADNVSTPVIDAYYEKAMQIGATGGKILGAGGGGFLLFFVAPELQDKVKEGLSDLIHVPFKFENSGSRVVLYQPDGHSPD